MLQDEHVESRVNDMVEPWRVALGALASTCFCAFTPTIPQLRYKSAINITILDFIGSGGEFDSEKHC